MIETLHLHFPAQPGASTLLMGRGSWARLGQHLAPPCSSNRIFLISDKTVDALHGDAVRAHLQQAGLLVHTLTFDAGEQAKAFAQVERLTQELAGFHVERGDSLVALGGGVAGDLAGFVAAIMLRGLDVVQLPTSLLAQVDSCVGGKTGINLPQGKNLVGAFHQPRLVVIDPACLATLPARHARAGAAEILKIALALDAAFFADVERWGASILDSGDHQDQAIARAVRAKALLVQADERESGPRMLLNLGHTFGHALEAWTGYSDALLHGEAVALGTCLAFRLSVHLGLCAPADEERVTRAFAQLGLPTRLRAVLPAAQEVDAVMNLMAQDKKNRGGTLTLVLARGIGNGFVEQNSDSARVREFLIQEGGRP